MAGHTFDNALTGQTTSLQLPYVAVMSVLIPAKFYWSKAFPAKVGETIAGVQFSTDGALLIAHSSGAIGFIVVLNGITGAMVSARAYSSDASFNYDSRKKSLLISSGSSPMAYVLSNLKTSTTTASCTGQHFLKFDPLTFSTTPVWAQKTLVTTTGSTDCGHHGLAFGRTESLLYSFSYQAGVCTVTLVNSVGSSLWQYKILNGSPLNNNLLQYKAIDAATDMIIVTSGGNFINYNRIISSSSTPYSVMTGNLGYKDPTSSATREIRALFIIGLNSAVSLIYDTSNKMTDLAKIDFSALTITYQRTLPLMPVGGMTTGIFVSSTVYYVGSYGPGFIQDQTTTQLAFNSVANQQALVYSSDMTQTTCYLLSTAAAQGPITMTTLSISVQTPIYQPSALTFVADTAAQPMIDLVVSANTQVSWCPQIPAFTINTVTQATQTFSFTANTMTQTLSITPFSASVNCGSQSASFSYSAIDQADGLALNPIADLVSIDSLTGTMTVAITKPPGTYSIKVIGTLPDLVTQTSSIFTLNIGVAGNNAPTFSAPLSNALVPLNSFNSYQFPSMTDIDAGDIVSVSVVKDSATGLIPSFISMISANNTLSIYPTTMSQVQVYTIIVIITDNKTPSQYQFTLKVTNLAPIVTSTIPTQVDATFGQDVTFTLPTSLDPEGLPYTTSIISGPSFVSILSSTSMRIFPANCRTDLGTFIIVIKLEDKQPLNSNYSFNVSVQNMPPSFNGIELQNQTMMLATTLSYTLPTYQDPEGCPVTVTYEPKTLQQFIALQSSQLTFTPSQVFQQGNFEITVLLTDFQGLSTNATFSLTVYSPPKFTGSVTRQIDLMASNQAEYSLPVMPGISDEYVDHTGQLPRFVTFEFPSYKFLPNYQSDLGVFTIQGQLWNAYTCTSFQFRINVTNQAPIFVGGLSTEPLIVSINSIKTYQLPSAFDREGQAVKYKTYEVNKNSLPAFVLFNSSSLMFTILPLLKDLIGTYEIKVVLIDTLTAQSSYQFSISLKAQSDLNDASSKQNGTSSTNNNPSYAFRKVNSTKTQVKLSFINMIIIKITRDQQVSLKMTCAECQSKPLSDIVKQITNLSLEVTVLQSNTQYQIPYELTSKDINSSSITLLLKYPSPQNLSITQVPDRLQIRNLLRVQVAVNDAQVILSENYQVEGEIPPQFSQAFETQVASFLKGGRVTFTDSTSLNIFLGFLAQLVWSQLEDLSFFTINCMIAISIPGIPSIIQSVLIKLIYFDILYTEMWMPHFMSEIGLDLDTIDNDEAVNLQFSDSGFQSKQFLKNAGSTFFFILLYVLGWVLLLLLKCLSSMCSRLIPFKNLLQRNMMWKQSLNLLLSQFTPMMMCSLINLYDIRIKKDERVAEVSFWFSSAILAVLLSALICLFIKVWRLSKNLNIESINQFNLNYSQLTDGLKAQSSNCLVYFWQPFKLLRWVLTIIILLTLRSSPEIQTLLLLVLSLISQCMIAVIKPFETHLINRLSFFNEAAVSVYLFLTLMLTDYTETFGSQRLQIAWFVAIVLILTIAINLIVAAFQMFQSFIRFVRRRRFIRKLKDQVVALRPIVNENAATTETVNEFIEKNNIESQAQNQDFIIQKMIWSKPQKVVRFKSNKRGH